MVTIVDTDVLVDLAVRNSAWHGWSQGYVFLAFKRGAVVINPIIYAELSVGIEKIEDLDEFLGADFRRDSLSWEAAFIAGKAFLAYRRRGGSKTAPLPDFYIGAHAAVQGMRILTRDPKRYTSYFPTVKIIET